MIIMDYQNGEKEKKGEIKEDTKKVLLCSFKKYTKGQTNGVLFINTEIEENKDLITEYYETDSFEQANTSIKSLFLFIILSFVSIIFCEIK